MAGTGSIALERQEKLNETKHAWKMNEMVRLNIKVLLQASTSLCSDFLSVFSYLAFTCSVMRAFVLVYIHTSESDLHSCEATTAAAKESQKNY